MAITEAGTNTFRCSSRPGRRRLTGVVWGLASTLALLLAPAAVAAQQETGRLVGRVVSEETGQPIAGAHVAVAAGRFGALTNAEGRFVVQGLPAGVHEVTVSVIGHARARAEVDVAAGAVAQLDLSMVREAVDLGAIAVRGVVERGNVSALLAERQRAAGVVDAIGAEQIGRTGDGDAATAIRRVSGVSVQDGRYVFVRGLGERYTTASLNGARIPSPEPERRVVPLDLFPAGMLQSITTSKTFTPDQPGDFSGAQVDLRTREFPGQREVRMSMSLGYSPEIAGGDWIAPPMGGRDWFALGAGARGIPAAADQFVSGSRGPEVDAVVGSFRNVWSVRQETAPPTGSIGISVGGRDDVLGREVGYLVSGTYSAGAAMALDQRRALAGAGGTEYNRYDGRSGRYEVLWGGLANLGTQLGGHTRIDVSASYNRSADNEARLEEGVDEDTNARVRIERLQYVERSVRSTQLRAAHELGERHGLRWSATTSGVERHEPDRSEFVTWLDPEVPVWFKHEEGAVRSFGGLSESNREAAVDYELHIGDLARPHRLMVGGQLRDTDRQASSQVFRIQPFDWTPTDERWQAEPEEVFDGRHTGGPEGEFLLARDRSGGSYAADDRVTAGYVMADIALGERVRLLGGARVEHARLVLDYESQIGAVGTAEPEYTDVLPSLALNIDLTESHKLRLAASRTLARPEYREIAPITYREVLGGEQVIGNRDLRRTLIRNYDVRWEWYPTLRETVSIGLFAKEFTDPIEQRFLARSGTDTRTFENADRAVNYGVELEVMHGLGFVGAALEPVSVFGNLTVMRSEVETGREGDAPRAMVGQAPYVVNTGVSWAPADSGYAATLLYNTVGPRIVNARAAGSEVADVMEQPRPGLDLSLRFPVPGGMNGKLDLKNLLDSPYELRQGETVRAYHRTGRSVSVGVTWRP